MLSIQSYPSIWIFERDLLRLWRRGVRDRRYITEHRGGPLTPENHRLLAIWAAECAAHHLHLFTDRHPDDWRPEQAIETIRAWARGECSADTAHVAGIASHAASLEVDTEPGRLLARAAGHAAVTAHMADHAPEAAIYAQRAVRAAAGLVDGVTIAVGERRWQMAQLPAGIRELVLSTLESR